MRSINTKEFRKAMIDADYNTLGDLEKESGIDKSSLSSILNGNGGRLPSYDSIAKLADALHLSYEEIGCIFFYNDLAKVKET